MAANNIRNNINNIIIKPTVIRNVEVVKKQLLRNILLIFHCDFKSFVIMSRKNEFYQESREILHLSEIVGITSIN